MYLMVVLTILMNEYSFILVDVSCLFKKLFCTYKYRITNSLLNPVFLDVIETAKLPENLNHDLFYNKKCITIIVKFCIFYTY